MGHYNPRLDQRDSLGIQEPKWEWQSLTIYQRSNPWQVWPEWRLGRLAGWQTGWQTLNKADL